MAPLSKTIQPSAKAVALMLLVGLAGIVLVLRAWSLWPFASALQTTDNAYVRGQVTQLAPQVNGHVAEVLVQDYQPVLAGQALLRIDDRIYRQRVDQADAQIAAAQADLANADQTQAQAEAALMASRASLVSLQAEQQRSTAEQARVDELSAKGSVSLNERDKVRVATRSAQANVLKGQADIRVGEERIKSVRVSREGLKAKLQAAQAQQELAQIDLDNTVIRAPRDGQLGEVGVKAGQYVAVGTQLMALVPDQVWVVANFKETQVAHMRAGQPATVRVDALGGAKLQAVVERFAPATGSEFSVLRPDNATGNFTKVVQRLPVRLRLLPDQPLAQRLAPGLSVEVTVDTREPGDAAVPGTASDAPSGMPSGTPSGGQSRTPPAAASARANTAITSASVAASASQPAAPAAEGGR
ncbi:HlyD family secretion protein [Comamonas serinivorans]|nr:HlyD family secretion protein [Comamonas serinivorans]